MTTDDTRPLTDGGRWLLDHQGLVNISKPAHHSMRGDEIDLRAAIITIEREAADAERARHAALVAAARAVLDWLDEHFDGSDVQAALRAALDGEPRPCAHMDADLNSAP